MARKSNPSTLVAPSSPPAALIHDMAQSAEALALLTQAEARVRAVAARVSYQLPADCIDPDLIQRDISLNMRRSAEAVLEVGRGLCVLKEACAHGNFLARLEVIGLDRTVAVRFMQAAAKFSNVASTQLLKAAGNQTKLFELLVLDDEEIEELELTGQTGELQLDAIASMGVRELRAAVRDREAKIKIKDAVAEKTAERMQALEEQLVARTPEMLHEALLKELGSSALLAAAHVTAGLRSVAIRLLKEAGVDDPIARQAVAAALGQVAAAVRGLSQDLEILPQAADEIDPEGAQDAAIWAATMRDFNAQKAAEAGEQAPAPAPTKPLRAVRRSDDHGQPGA